jgi:hypothetical protein
MFELGFDQAAGLRTQPRPAAGASLVPVACPAQPARAYEWLCTLAAHLATPKRAVVIVDGSAPESERWARDDGRHLGLLRALQDPSVAGLGRPVDGVEWLVMPGALGLQSLQDTARAGGAGVALSRLLAPFAPQAMVLLFAPAQVLGTLLGGSAARVLVPVLEQPQATFDAYGAVKLLHTAGLSPVLGALAAADAAPAAALQQTVNTVTDCAERHLGLALDAWLAPTWCLRVPEAALTCAPRAEQAWPAAAAAAATRTAGAHSLWS